MRLPRLCVLLAGFVMVLTTGCFCCEHRVFHRRFRQPAEGCCDCAAPVPDCHCCGAPPLPPPPLIVPVPQLAPPGH